MSRTDRLQAAISDVLFVALPIPPLVSLIVEYAIPAPSVSTVSQCYRPSSCAYVCEVGRPYLLLLKGFSAPASRLDLSTYATSWISSASSIGPIPPGPNGITLSLGVPPKDRGVYVPHGHRLGHIKYGELAVVVAGSTQAGWVDATGTNAQFSTLTGVACSTDGKFALLSDSGNHCIRRIDLKSFAVTTVGGVAQSGGLTDGPYGIGKLTSPDLIVIDDDAPHPTAVTGSTGPAAYIRTSNSVIRVLELSTGGLTTLNIPKLAVAGMALVARHTLALVCSARMSLYTFDTRTGESKLLTGSSSYQHDVSCDGPLSQGRFDRPVGVCVGIDPRSNEQVLYVCTSDHIRSVELPSHFKPLPYPPPLVLA